MINVAHWIKIGTDWIAVDSHNGVCGVLKCLDDESIIRVINGPQNASQKPDNINEHLKYIAATSKMPNIISKPS